MRSIIFFLLLFPFLCIAQPASIVIDSVGNNARIKYDGARTNILIGNNSGNINGTGEDNTFIGQNAGSNHTAGIRNVNIGSNAGLNLAAGYYNINIGVSAGNRNQSGYGNINIGDEAGYIDTLGENNIRIGDYTGRNSKGNRNIMIGKSAGLSFIGDDRLIIDNSNTTQPLLHGFFADDSLVINGDLNVTGKIIGTSIEIMGLLGNGYSAVFPEVLDNTVSLEINSILPLTNVLITNSIGFEIDTFTLPGGGGGTCLDPNTAFTGEFPITFETDNAADIALLQSWFASPNARSGSIIIKNIGGAETTRYNFYDYVPNSTGPGTDGRTSFTLFHNLAPNTTQGVEIMEYLGSSASYDPVTDKVVEITGISHTDFCPAVEVDYTKRVITLEMTYNEGAGLIDWINGFATGIIDKKSMSIIETVNGPGTTETSRENFFEVVPFKYEVSYGFGLNTKQKAKIQLLYGCNEPG